MRISGLGFPGILSFLLPPSPNIYKQFYFTSRIPFTSQNKSVLLTYRVVVCDVTQLRTVQSDGLIMYSGDVTGVPGYDFMAVELVSGRVQYSFDLGGGSRVLPDAGQRLVNDGQWHSIYVSRPTVDRHILMVCTQSS